MGVYDQAARFAAQADPPSVPGRLLRPARSPLAFRGWFDTRATPRPGGRDRTADLVAALDDPARPEIPWLLVVEFQARHDPDKLDVTLEEVASLRCRARHAKGKYKVLSGLVYLIGECPEPALDMTTPDGDGTRHRPLVWEVAKDDALATVEAVRAGRLSWGSLF